MRADAQRNYDRIVEVARDVFREKGYDASLDEVAKRAGVGPGTLYRHFPTRENLLDAMMKSWMEGVDEAAEKALATEGSPRDLLVAWLRAYVNLISMHKGGPAKITSALEDDASPIKSKCQTLTAATDKVVGRLADAGALRPGVDAVTMCRLVGGVAVVGDQGNLDESAVLPLLELVADGMLR
jgi:AcrR family transcriptional regulator